MLRGLNAVRTLLSKTHPKEQVKLFSIATKPSTLDDESLWVKSPLPDVETVVGYTIPEIIRENIGPWGNLPAFVCFHT